MAHEITFYGTGLGMYTVWLAGREDTQIERSAYLAHLDTIEFLDDAEYFEGC